MKKLVVLSGAGISAESGVSTFRDSNGLWENHRIEDVATPYAWMKNPELVHEFYNQRRLQLQQVSPNYGHLGLVELEKHFEVNIITQNVDNLHERAGSKNILHLHGELMKMRSSGPSQKIFDINGSKLSYSTADKCEEGYLLRPHIVWFGEDVPLIKIAEELVSKADIFIIIGTSLQVYPAAGLINYTKPDCLSYLIDPSPNHVNGKNITYISKIASEGIKELITILTNKKNEY